MRLAARLTFMRLYAQHFMRTLLSFLLILLAVTAGRAQSDDDLFGAGEVAPRRKGIVIGFNTGLDLPAADMADRFGFSARVGPSVFYKTRSNWMIGLKGDFLFGSKIREDSLLVNVEDADGLFLDDAGQRTGAAVNMRGYAIGVQAGRIFGLTPQADAGGRGILVLLGAGFIQHKIQFFNQQQSIAQIREDYRKGYDRLTNGIYTEAFGGYNHFSKKGFFNFHIGLNALVGFTGGRRDYLFDVQRSGTGSRLDVLLGVRGGLYLPLWKKRSEEVFFE